MRASLRTSRMVTAHETASFADRLWRKCLGRSTKCDGCRIRMGAVAGDVGSIRLRTSPFCYDGCRQKPALIAVVASQGS